MPDSHHDTHDLELVAAFAAGDATGADLETVTALVASCADCAALHHDLRAIAAALPAIPVPVRPRDFRLTQEQAASLRPRGFRGILAAFASPKLSFATPLGTGLAAIGIVGVLVASGGLPVGGGATSGAAAEDANVSREAASQLEIKLASPGTDDRVVPVAPVAGADGGDVGAEPVAPSPGSSPAGASELYEAPSASDAAQEHVTAADVAADVTADLTQRPDQALLFVGVGLLLTGVALVVLRWVSRRLA